ncbi:MAG TPA: hypothetical protein VGC74_08490 [Stenotrophomonas sp.]|jgi:hypothetical protein
MKTPYEVGQEIDRVQRLVPHLISDQGERAEEILGFHIASLYASAPPSEHAQIRRRVAQMLRQCQDGANEDEPRGAAVVLEAHCA